MSGGMIALIVCLVIFFVFVVAAALYCVKQNEKKIQENRMRKIHPKKKAEKVTKAKDQEENPQANTETGINNTKVHLNKPEPPSAKNNLTEMQPINSYQMPQ